MYGDIDPDNEDVIELEFDEKNDHLKFANDKEIKDIISNEKFLLSDIISRKNMLGFNQWQNIVITDNALYCLKGKKLLSRFDISKLKGITTSIAKGSQEFIVHGNEEEQDYLYNAKNKFSIIYVLEGVYEKLSGKPADFIFTNSTSLKNRITTKNEKKSNPKFSRMDDSELSDITEFFKKLYYNESHEIEYIETDEDEETETKKNLIPFLKEKQTENTEKRTVQSDFHPKNSLSSSINLSRSSMRFSKKSNLRMTLSSYKDTNTNDQMWDMDGSNVMGTFDEEFYEEEGDEAIALKPAKFEDFNFICCIGKGRNSSTYIAKHEKYGVIYAVKVTDKEKILVNKCVDSLKIEKKILTSLVALNKCIVQMVNCFQIFDKIFFTYPFYRGGDLFSFLQKQGGNLRENPDLLFFYICQLVIFLIKIHENKIIYRNLKPENIIIDDKGNLKMTDFSKSKLLSFDGDKGLSLVGAPDYMAPEVILGKGQNYEVDWWTLGILIYQLYYGYTPFEDEYIDKTYQKVLFSNVHFRSNVEIDPNLQELIESLLEKDDSKRVKDSEIQNKRYFVEKEVDWSKVANFEIECPLKPKINEEVEDDIQNFDREFTNQKFDNEIIKCGEVLEYIKSADSCGVFDYFH